MNIKDLIIQKVENLEKFVTQKFPTNSLIIEQFKQLNKMPIELFIDYIKRYIVIHKNNMDVFFNKMLEDYKISRDDVNVEDLEKFKKYFNFFIEVCEDL
jgi:hypothetical protein